MSPRAPKAADSDSAFTDLLERAQRVYPQATILADGESLAGEFIRLESGPTRDYGDQPVVIYTDATSGEERSLWLLNVALKTQFVRANPKVGDKFVVAHLGKRLAKKSGREYADYKVVVAGAPDAPAPGTLTFADVAATLDAETPGENGNGAA